ncbi:hypothetical protein DMUE_4592 [Dictyocoela muelleri]|nr:hypothetical protein DMUE_4592 [Dictyocoela muelleri]
MCFILLESKEEKAYLNALDKVKRLCTTEPIGVITYFEKALINAVQKIFSSARTLGCQFHFRQSLFRCLKDSCRLSKVYRDKPDIKSIFRKILNLTFFPIKDCYEEYLNIRVESQILNVYDDLVGFFEYFEKTYIGRFEDRQFIQQSYPIEFWRCFKRVSSQ